jgi:DNA-binding transcriptional regulator YhcF (GntR family)
MAALPIQLDHARRSSLAAQIYSAIREGIENGRLASGARLPSWQDLAAQLGVSRGTVRVAYERLIAEQFAIGLGPAGTRVAERQSRSSIPDWSPEAPLLPDLFYEFGNAPLAFQMGVPAQDCEQEFRLRRPLGVMSASLIGPLGSSTFRLSTNAVSMSLAGSCFSSESAAGPFHHGIRGRGGTIFWTTLPSV